MKVEVQLKYDGFLEPPRLLTFPRIMDGLTERVKSVYYQGGFCVLFIDRFGNGKLHSPVSSFKIAIPATEISQVMTDEEG